MFDKVYNSIKIDKKVNELIDVPKEKLNESIFHKKD